MVNKDTFILCTLLGYFIIRIANSVKHLYLAHVKRLYNIHYNIVPTQVEKDARRFS